MALDLASDYYQQKRRMVQVALFFCLSTVILLSSFLFVLLKPAHADSINTTDFVTTWKTDNPGSSNSSSITIPTAGADSNYDVDWNNDGTFDQFGITGDVTHDFGTPGTYTIRIRGNFPFIQFNNTGDCQKIIDINQWGTGTWLTMNRAFYGASNLVSTATDAPNLSNVADMSLAFARATIFNSDLSNWDTSHVTDMNHMFLADVSFNSDLSDWDTSHVTDMENMFDGASIFTSDLSRWSTDKLTDTYRMFADASMFNSDLSNWDTSHVKNMDFMFSYATSFNGNLSTWDTSSVISMDSMFANASSFNSNISNWDTSNVASMSQLFAGASSFNSNISNWDTSKVMSMINMFYGASNFNQSLANWNMSTVINLAAMFYGSGFSSENYNTTLKGWSTQILKSNVNLSVEGLTYCSASADRQSIIDNFSWIINGDSIACPLYLNNGYSVSIESDVAVGTKVGVLITTDGLMPRPTSPYSLSCDLAGADDRFFTIMNNDELLTDDLFDYNVPSDENGNNIYDICVQMTDVDGNTIDQPMQILVTQPLIPIIDSLSVNSVAVDGYDKTVYIYGSAFSPNIEVKFGTTVMSAVSSERVIAVTVPTTNFAIDTIVDVTVTNPNGKSFTLTNGFTYKIPQPKQINFISFTENAGKKLLTVTGTGLVGGTNPAEYAEALSRSLVELNAINLPFCADGVGAGSAQDIVDLFSISPELVSDIPACYFLANDTGIAITPTQVIIWLPLNFDTTTQGTVSVNGSNTYTFNATGGGGITPTVTANGNKALTKIPTIPARPTFSGVAEPGSTITVTVHSDPVVCTATADSSGNWSCTLPSNLAPGTHTVTVVVTSPDGRTSVTLGPYTVTVSGTITNNTPLAPNTGFLQLVRQHKAAKQHEQQLQAVLAAASLIAIFTSIGFVVWKKKTRITFSHKI